MGTWISVVLSFDFANNKMIAGFQHMNGGVVDSYDSSYAGWSFTPGSITMYFGADRNPSRSAVDVQNLKFTYKAMPNSYLMLFHHRKFFAFVKTISI